MSDGLSIAGVVFGIIGSAVAIASTLWPRNQRTSTPPMRGSVADARIDAIEARVAHTDMRVDGLEQRERTAMVELAGIAGRIKGMKGGSP